MIVHYPEGNDPVLVAGTAALTISGSPAQKKMSFAQPFKADRTDALFALFAFVLGFYFSRWVLFSWQGWGVTLFTIGYCAALTMYMMKKGVRMPRAGWFWLTIVVLTGTSYSFWTNQGIEPWRSLLLLCSAVYWIITATGALILGKTSDLVWLDGFNGMAVIPFRNFGCQYKSLAFWEWSKRVKGGRILSIVLGLFLGLMVISIVLPQLLAADSGGFSRIANGIVNWMKNLKVEFGELFRDLIFAVPVAAYLFGLAAGSIHKRGTRLFKAENTVSSLANLRVLPMETVYILLGSISLLYLVFIASQTPYFFSAFVGRRPEGWQVYSEYARSGFFELCRIAAINLSVLATANVMSKKSSQDSLILKALNSLLAVLSLVLIATALSKMFLYIGAYGLSIRRLLPCFFMVFMAIVCGAVVALQKWEFSIGRLAASVGVVMLCALCLADPDGLVARYNADRYLSGTLGDFDVGILYRSGPAGVEPALKVYAQTGDKALQAEIKDYLLYQQNRAAEFKGQSEDNLQWVRARQTIAEYPW